MPAATARDVLPRMTVLPEKARPYQSEVWFRESWQDLAPPPERAREHAEVSA
jgi:hypothetical protein